MKDVALMVLAALLQIMGAGYAFGYDGVLAKLSGLLFCVSALLCFAAAVVFAKNETKKGE